MSVFLVIGTVVSVLTVVGAILVLTTSSAGGFEGQVVPQPIESESPYEKRVS